MADFGLATEQDKQNSFAGSAFWVAPEVIDQSVANAQTASDIWSLGSTVIELLTGKPPFIDLHQFAAMTRIKEIG